MDGRRARIVLGVGNDAGPDELRRAFRARARALHPDHGGNNAAFAELKSAFDTLRAIPVRERIVRYVPRVAAARGVPRVVTRVDVYDSPRRPAPRREFADVLRAATARLG